MKRLCLLLAAIATWPALSHAAEPMKPTLEVRVQSIDQLLKYAGFVGEIAGEREQAENMANAVKAFTNKKGLQGFDTKKPFGLYAEMSKDVIDSPMILLVPIADEETARKTMTDMAKLKLKSLGDGLYETDLPNVPMPLVMKFKNGYMHATLGSKANFDRAIEPTTYFASKSNLIADIQFHIDRIPADVRKVILGQVEFQLQRQKDEVMKSGKPNAEKLFSSFILDGTSAALKTVLDDAKTLAMNLSVNQDSDLISFDTRLVPKAGSPLAKMIANAKTKPNTTYGRVQAKNPMAAMSINLALSDEQRKKLDPTIDEFLNEAEGKADPFVAELVKKFFASIEPTMKSGDLDFSMVLDGPDSKGKQQMNMMLKMKKGIDLVDTLVESSKIIPAGIIEMKFDTAKVDNQKMHSFTIHENPGKLEELFDSATIWAGTSDTLLSLSFEKDGAMLKNALAAKATPGKIVDIDLALGRLAVFLAEPDKRDAMKKAVKEIGIDNSAADRAKLTVEGGSELKINLAVTGKALRVLTTIDKVNKTN